MLEIEATAERYDHGCHEKENHLIYINIKFEFFFRDCAFLKVSTTLEYVFKELEIN